MAITIAGDLLIATALTLDRNPSLFASSVTRLQCRRFYPQRPVIPLDGP
jgi:hypothetical protein